MDLHPAQSLLLEYFQPPPGARILALEGGDGSFAMELARLVPEGHVLNLNRDYRAFWKSRSLLPLSLNVCTEPLDFPFSTNFDFVLLTIPKERSFTSTLLLASWNALNPGGTLLLSGPTRKGAKAAITDAGRLFGSTSVLGFRSHHRVASCTKGKSIPDPMPEAFQQVGISPGTTHSFSITHEQRTLTLETHPGIFSWERLDQGTALLLEHLPNVDERVVWDVGCGYGALGLTAALAGADQVWMTDINRLALTYAKKNASLNDLNEKVRIFPADGLKAFSPLPFTIPSFDIVISNPAFHQDHTVDRSMAAQIIVKAPNYLKSNGILLIVANRFLNYDQQLKNHFKEVTTLIETSKFHIIQARKF